MTWLQTLPTLCISALMIFLPGAIWARCLGARGMMWLGMSAPLSISLIGVGAIVAKEVHIGWSVLALVAVTLLASAISLAVRLVLMHRGLVAHAPSWTYPAVTTTAALGVGLLFGAATIMWRFTRMFITPENISQTYDNVFHLNAVRFIIESGNGSSLFLGSLEIAGPPSFYPGAWHDLVALVVETGNSSVPVGVNSVNMVIGALVWTVSSMYLATRLTGTRPAILLMTGALAGAFSAFPYLLMEFGVLYPNFLAIAILPAMIAVTTDALRISAQPAPSLLVAWIILVLAIPGLALAHPSVFLAFGAFALPLFLTWLAKLLLQLRRQGRRWYRYVAPVSFVLIYTTVLLLVWQRVRPSEKASFWPPTQTISQAFGEAIANAPQRGPMSWMIVSLTIIGLYALLKERKQWWHLGVFAIGIMFYVVVSGFAETDLRSFITGVFYNDSFRLAALLPVAALPLTAFGAVRIYDTIRPQLTPQLGGRTFPRSIVVVGWTLIGLSIGVLAQDNSVDTAQNRGTRVYQMTAESSLLSVDEATLISRADSKIPEGATVIANPATGASLVYALANRHVILPAVGSRPSPDDKLVIQQLGELQPSAAVCGAVARLDAFYILDFGDKSINNMHIPFPESQALASNPGLELVDQEGSAKLYRIESCQ